MSAPFTSLGVGLAALALGVVALLGSAPPAAGHAFAPALLELRETTPGEIAVRFKQPAVRAAGSALRPILPATCRALEAPSMGAEGTGLVMRWRVRCDAPVGAGALVGQTIAVAGIAGSRADVLLRVELADGRTMRHVLTFDRPRFVVPERESRLDVGASYAGLGVEHILGGYDHLLFVLGLLLLVGGGRRLVATVTAFTLGHSVTLALAALGVVHVPQAPVEALIAASLFVLAVQLSRRQQAPRHAFVMAAGFGLLHGLGFAGALSEAGLPQHDVPAALFAFNLGIEVGQLAFVAAMLVLAASGRWLAARSRHAALPALVERARWLPIYAIGILSVAWCLERTLA